MKIEHLPEPSNVVFFVTSLDSGGIENYLLRFLREKHKCFKNIYVWCKSGLDGQLDKDYIFLGNVTLVKEKLGYFEILSYQKLKCFVRGKSIDIVCDFTGNFSGRVLHAAKKAGVKKRVAFYRSASDAFESTGLRRLYSSWIRSLVLDCATDVLSNSMSAFSYFYSEKWIYDERFKVIFNGVNHRDFTSISSNLRQELGIPFNAYVVGHVGRYNKSKNHSCILDVAKKMIGRYEDVYFILCGNGVRSNLQDEVIKSNLTDRVLLFENRTDVPRFLNTMDCYFFPSTREGQPNALIEAMITGLPFVASNIPPIREAVGSEYQLYDVSDLDSLVAAIEGKYLERSGRNLELQKTIRERFDYKVRFNEFYQVMIAR